ncbi:MAG TPA: helicase-associated domain-containing protein [Candidatus Hydrogenedentes bacterium]|nr:helicase-associated domain-containing protein [Candidatus Hydrogenedentota bacterium]HOM47613.1 helicase-associated domain-containing protein [Candidatus Hydrogenedentota bacterium]HPX85078.1 helicase-associated domain-containing protein [Candidatus Hydrogenedentota bacterium]
MTRYEEKPVIVQSDRSILLETDGPLFEEARDCLAAFSELVKSPEHIHTYKLSPLALWNAASLGLSATEVVDSLKRFSRYEIPQNILADIQDQMSRYGRIKLYRKDDGGLVLSADHPLLIRELLSHRQIKDLVFPAEDTHTLSVKAENRGNLKSALIKIGFPVEDLAGYADGAPLEIAVRETTLSGRPFGLRQYQKESVDAFYLNGSNQGGSGVIVLPCGAGKTIVAIGAIAAVKSHTLILATNTVALRQWKSELLDKTTLREDDIGEYSGDKKEVRPVTIATYQVLTYRKTKNSPFTHFDLFDKALWGLVVYDEVHTLPAPVFRATASIQAKRRLGLTATLVREDGQEEEVFSLIGPKKYDVPWKVLEKQGWIAEAACAEIRVPLPDNLRFEYAVAPKRNKFRIASTNPEKIVLCEKLIESHKEDNILVIGQYLSQLKEIARHFKAPIITGQTPVGRRQELYAVFRKGDIKLIIVSKVANFAIDLPDANVAIQVSGTFGSRQEEAQRLGRILRPKVSASPQACFYSLVSKDTCDQDFALKRQMFLTEQGYQYRIVEAARLDEFMQGE